MGSSTQGVATPYNLPIHTASPMLKQWLLAARNVLSWQPTMFCVFRSYNITVMCCVAERDMDTLFNYLRA